MRALAVPVALVAFALLAPAPVLAADSLPMSRMLLQTGWALLVVVGLIPMTIRRLLALRAGEVIEMPYNPDQPLTVLVEDQPLFTAIAGERNGCRAVHVTGRHSHPRGTIHGDT